MAHWPMRVGDLEATSIRLGNWAESHPTSAVASQPADAADVAMERYRGRVAMVTGASAGIGAAITQALLREGLTVVGVARRVHRVQALELKDAPGKLHAVEGDVSSEESILSVFKWVKDNLGGVDILINNAGVSAEAAPSSGKTADWKHILDVNVLGLSICTREAVQDMLARGVDDGFIIHINSVAAHIPAFDEVYAMYCASKHAVSALLDGLRLDLVSRKSSIRVGQISPGIVATEIFDNLTKLSKESILSVAHLQPEDVAAAVVYMLSQHPRVQVHDIVLRPTGSTL